MGVVKFGIAGTGRMAETMLRAFRQAPGIEVIAIHSTSAPRAAEFAARHGIEASSGELGRFLADERMDAVYIANRNVEHAATAIAALTAGKAVLCEKPFAVTLEEGQAVMQCARSAKRLFMEAMWTPFLPAYTRLRDLVRSGSFGPPRHLRFDFGYPTTAQQHPLLFAPGGGVLLDRSAYGISFALSIFGAVETVEAALDLDQDGVDVGACLQLTHRTGGHSQLGVSLTSLMSNTATVSCAGGMVGLPAPTIGAESVCFQRMSASTAARGQEPGPGLKERTLQRLKRQPLVRRLKSARSGPTVEHCSFGADPYLPQALHFADLIRTARLQSDVNTLESSLAALQIIQTAKSMRIGS